MPPTPTCVTPAELAAGAADTPLLGERAAVRTPLLGVDLDAPAHPGAAEAAGRSDRVLVGVRMAPGPVPPLAGALDVTLAAGRPPDGRDTAGCELGRTTVAVPDPHVELAELHAVAEANPGPALVLAGLLRAGCRAAGGESRGGDLQRVRDGLDAESLAYSTLLGGPEFRRWLDGRGARPLPPPATDPVLLRRDGDELTITLNRPRRRNAYGRELRDALVEGLRLALADASVERVVLDGAGPAFCSGGDLDEFGTTPDLVTAHLVRTRAGAGRLLAELADRVEVRLHGPCVGAGIELPAFAGRVLAAPGATFRLPEVGMGLVPGAGGTVSVPRRIGRWRALHLALTGRAVDVGTALEWGLVDGLWDGPPQTPTVARGSVPS